MKTVDNTYMSLDEVKISGNFIRHIANKELKELESEQLFLFPPDLKQSDDLSAEQKVLEANSSFLKTTNIMGLIGYNDEQLFISSRFDKKNDYFFYYLMKKVLNINIVDQDINMEKKKGYLEILIFLFPRYLNLALRKGLFKEYQLFYHNDSNIKGKINFKEHLKGNIPFTGKIAYTTREFSYHNPVLNLIRYTIEFIKMRKDFRRVLNQDEVTKENIKQIEGYSFNYKKLDLLNVIQHNLKKPIRHGYYFEYRTLQLLCLEILRANESMYKKTGKNKVYGVLFDGAWLFEEYVHMLLKDNFHHPQNKKGIGKQYLFAGSVGLIYPDFISKDDRNRIVADAKYKRFSGIYGSDYLQLIAYMYRFNANQGYFIFPKSYDDNTEKNETLSLMTGIDKESSKRDEEVKVRKLGIRIYHDAKSFQEFEQEMAKEEKRFRHEFKLN